MSDIDGVEDIEVEYDVVDTVDVSDIPIDEPDQPEELDLDYGEVPDEEDAGE